MEQHAIPQHIASFEFKLFGNLTVRQFVTLAIPMAVAALFLFSNLPVFLRYSMAVIFGSVGLFAALVPIQGRPLDKWVVLFIKAILAPTQRIWVKDIRLPEFLNVVVSRQPGGSREAEPIMAGDRDKLKTYLRSLPKGQVSPFDVKEQIAVQRLNLSMDGAEGGHLPQAIGWVGKPQGKFEGALPTMAQVPTVSMAASAGVPVSESEYRGAMASALPSVFGKKARVRVSQHAKPYVLQGTEKRLEKILHHVGEVVKPKVQLASDTNFTLDNIIPIAQPGRRVRLVHGIGRARARKLHFAPPAGFDLSHLPIRGEARFEVSEGLKHTLDPSLFAQEPEKVIPRVANHTETLRPRKPTINMGDSPSGHVANMAEVSQEMAHQAVLPVSEAGTNEKSLMGDTQVSVYATPLQKGARPAEILSRAQIVPLTNKPNVLSGLIVDGTGVPIEGAIITVRDAAGVPVRALKTNKLGQFLSATPLPTGQYMIDVDWENANFEPLSLNVAGEVLAPLAIKAKT